jgi:hypothetical protein
MTRRPIARVRVMHLPGGVVRVEVSCPLGGVTGITQVPAPDSFELPLAAMVTAGCFEHEAKCGQCSTEQAHAQGAQDLRRTTEDMYERIQAKRAARYAHSRRN